MNNTTTPEPQKPDVVRELAENFRAESERWWAAATKESTGNPMSTKYIERAETWAMAAERVEAEIEKLPNDAGQRQAGNAIVSNEPEREAGAEPGETNL